MQIDLNSDLGEGCEHDADLIPLITTANIACGFHAGSAEIAYRTMQTALQHNVRIGAHPGFADREHFGRRELSLEPNAIYQQCIYQIGALSALAQSLGAKLSHVKPHGALYNMACRDASVAQPVVDAVALFGLPLIGLPNSQLEVLCRGKCSFVAEGFADRRYQPNGALVPRSQPDAFVTDPNDAVDQVLRLMSEIGIHTICVHGDNPKALEFVRALRKTLNERGLSIRAFA